MQTIAYYRIAKEDMDSTGYEIGLMGMEGRGAPSVVMIENTSSQTSSLVLIFSKKVGFSLVPRPLSFLESISSQHHLWC